MPILGTPPTIGQNYVNVYSYGARPDSVSRSDGVANSTTTVTSASGTFTNADIGKLFLIYSGATVHQSTIASVESATSITLADAVTFSGSSKKYTYGTDSTAAIANAISDLGTSDLYYSKVLYFPGGSGAYLDTDTHDFSLTDNITILGDSAKQWPNDSLVMTPVSEWRCCNSDSTAFVDARGTHAFRVIGVGLRVEHQSYSGTVLDLSGHADRHTFNAQVNNALIGDARTSMQNATGVDVRGIVLGTFEHTTFWGMATGVVTVNGANSYANVVRFRDCIWSAYYTGGAVALTASALPSQWLFDGCTFEYSTNPNVPAVKMATAAAIAFVNTGFWDNLGGTTGSIQQTGGTVNGLSLNGCYFELGDTSYALALGTIDGLTISGTRFLSGGTATVFKTGITATNFEYQGNSHTNVTDNSGVTGGGLSI